MLLILITATLMELCMSHFFKSYCYQIFYKSYHCYNSADAACSLYDQILNPDYFQLDYYMYKIWKIVIDMKMLNTPNTCVIIEQTLIQSYRNHLPQAYITIRNVLTTQHYNSLKYLVKGHQNTSNGNHNNPQKE